MTIFLRADSREELEQALIDAGMLAASEDEALACDCRDYALDWLPHPLLHVTGYDDDAGEAITEVVEGFHANLRVRYPAMLEPLIAAGVVLDPAPSEPLRQYAVMVTE